MKINQIIDEACWQGYHKEGMKTMFGKKYPNCVKNKKKNNENVSAKQGIEEASGDKMGQITSITPAGDVKIKTPSGTEITTKKDALLPGAQPGTVQMKPDATDDALKPGVEVVSAEALDDVEEDQAADNVTSPISGAEDHDEITKLLVQRIRKLAGL